MVDWLTRKKIRNIKFLLHIAIIPLLFGAFLIYGAYKDNDLITQIHSESVNATYNAKFDVIKAILREKNIQAKQNTNKLKELIINDIFTKYGSDMDALKYDMHSNNPSKLSKLLHDDMDKIYIPHMDVNNRLWIATREGILADKESLMGPNKSFRTWDEEYNLSINKFLYKSTIDRIISKDVYGELLYIDGPSLDTYIEESVSQEAGFKNLENMYKTKGMEEISKYNILICSYIYDSYDIFNVPDVSPDGTITNNDTIIIVEQYNIGDALKDHEDLFKTYDDMISRYDYWSDKVKYKSMNDAINLLIIMLISSFLILGATSIYTKWSEKHDREYNDKHFDN